MEVSNVNLGLVQDVNGLDKLRKMSNSTLEDKKNALLTAAEQFESILNQFWLKAMRESNDSICPNSPLKSNESSFFQSMLDEQMVTSIAKSSSANKSSISHMIVKQFAQSMGDDGKKIMEMIDGANKLDNTFENYNLSKETVHQKIVQNGNDSLNIDNDYNLPSYIPNLSTTNHSKKNEENFTEKLLSKIGTKIANTYKSVKDLNEQLTFESPKDFVDKLMPLAVNVAKKFNLNPVVIVAQAALETGWGKHIGAKNNFFGIKSSNSWNGESQLKASDEYIDGQKVSQVSSFRAYDNALSSIEDYAKLISSSNRYSKAHAASANPDRYFEEIQKAGYATDPQYAAKLKGIIRNEVFKDFL